MLTLAQVAKILVAHGVVLTHADDIAAFEAFVAESCSHAGCSRRALRDYLGY